MKKMVPACCVLLACLFVPSVEASVIRAGATVGVIAAFVRGSAVAYDSINKVYLVASGHGVLRGRFVAADGTPLGQSFVIQTSSNHTSFPRLAFSPDADSGAGAFLVAWNETDLPNEMTSVHARLVSYSKGGPIGTDPQLAVAYSMFEAGPPVAYASGSKEFLVAWESLVTKDIAGARISNEGTVIAPLVIPPTPDGERDPSLAYNPVTDEFLLVFSGYNNASAFVEARRIKAGGGAVGDRIRLATTAGTYVTDVSYNTATNQFLAAWFSLPAGASSGRLVNADGMLPGDVITLSSRWRAYDALSLAYNNRSNSFFLVSHSDTAEVGGVEIASGGTPVDNGGYATQAGGQGNYHPRVAASSDQPNWLISAGNDFTKTVVQLIAGTNTGGTTPTPTPTPAPTPTPTPTPTPAVARPAKNIDVPGNGGRVPGNGFLIAGWALDAASTTDSGVSTVHVWAYPTNGSAATFLGVATYGVSRADVGAAFGNDRFTPSGFGLMAQLSPGTYDIAVFPYSKIAQAFTAASVVRVQVEAPISVPRMWVDTPEQGSNLSQNISVAGWALDFGSTTGTGVDAVHVWAYPANGGPAVLVGVAAYGSPRPDVGAAFGSTRYTNSGFSVQGTLPRGDYTIVAFAHSSVVKAFNNVVVIPVRVH